MSTLYNTANESRNFSKFRDFEGFSLLKFTDTNDVSLIPPDGFCNSYNSMGTGGIPLTSMIDEGIKRVRVDHTDNHSLVIGPTGTKKSRLIAMPTVRILCVAKESMVISDPKAEIYYRTGKFLHDNGYDVFVVNLREPNLGSGWNPLSIPYQFYKTGDIDRACEFANDISENLARINTKSNSTADPFWDNTAGSLFFGLTMLLFKYCIDHNQPDSSVKIGNIMRLKNTIFECENPALRRANSPLWKYAKSDYIIASALGGTIVSPNDTFGSIMSVFNEKMTIFQIRPSLLNMLSSSSEIFEEIDHKPTAVFLILPDEKTAYHGLASLLIKQSYEYIIFKAQKRAGDIMGAGTDVRLNYILDEFSSLPTINDFPAMITAARSRNIRFNIFIQSKHQLELKYGKDSETIQANCGNWIFLSSRELNLLEELSRLCGNEKKDKPSIPLVSVSDLQRLDKNHGEALVLSGRLRPHISRLLDINVYDKMNNKSDSIIAHSPSEQSIKKDWMQIDFPLEKEFCSRSGSPIEEMPVQRSQPNTALFDIDNLVMRIDQKIVELEQEEQRQKESAYDTQKPNKNQSPTGLKKEPNMKEGDQQ